MRPLSRGGLPGGCPAYDCRVRHYLDHAATTPLRPAAREAWLEASAQVGNASSLHASGRRARSFVEEARERVAAALGAHPTEVIFTSGGTEASNLAIKGLWWSRSRADARALRVVTTAVEHHAALDPARWLASAQGARCIELRVDVDGQVSLEALADTFARSERDCALLSLQWVNNELGTVQPLARAVALAHAHGVPVHSDAVQAPGHLAIDFAHSGLATMAVSAHKVGGPAGVGALLARRDSRLEPLLHGGGQERKVRSGTVDAAGVWAFAAALDEAVSALDTESARVCELAVALAAGIELAVPDAVVRAPEAAGGDGRQAPHIVHAIIPGAPAEALLFGLDQAGIDASPGAACTAGVIEPSHVVRALGGAEADAAQTVRFSLGWTSTQADVDAALAALPEAVARARSSR